MRGTARELRRCLGATAVGIGALLLLAAPASAQQGPGSTKGGSDVSSFKDTLKASAGQGANRDGPYEGDPTEILERGGKPCDGCVGRADDKNPGGQLGGRGRLQSAALESPFKNRGYECDDNPGVGDGNPAHTGCVTGGTNPPREDVLPPGKTPDVTPREETPPGTITPGRDIEDLPPAARDTVRRAERRLRDLGIDLPVSKAIPMAKLLPLSVAAPRVVPVEAPTLRPTLMRQAPRSVLAARGGGELATTGTDITGMLALSGTLFAVGTAAVAFGRRRQAEVWMTTALVVLPRAGMQQAA